MYSKQIIFLPQEQVNKKFNKLEVLLEDDKRTVSFSGNFSAPSPIKFKTTNEALAFIDGLLFMRNYIIYI